MATKPNRQRSAQADPLFARYLRHYLSTLVATSPSAWRIQLAGDFENIRSAWQRAIERCDAETIAHALAHFCDYVRQFGLLVDGDALFAGAAACFEADPDRRELVALLLDKQAYFVRSLGGLKAACPLHHRVLEFTSDPKLQAHAWMELANYCAEIGDWDQFDAYFQHAEAAAQKSTDVLIYLEVVEFHVHLNALHFRGDFAAGIACLESLLPLLETIEAAPGTPHALRVERYYTRIIQSISITAIRYGDYALALRYARQGIALAEQGTDHQRRIGLPFMP